MANTFEEKKFLDYPGLKEYHDHLIAEVIKIVETKYAEMTKDIVTMSYKAGVLTLTDGNLESNSPAT